MITPEEIKRGRELFLLIPRPQKLRKILVDEFQCWVLRNAGAVLAIAEEHQKLKESYASDVEAAFKEGNKSAFSSKYQFVNNAWSNSEAKKKLDGK